MGRIGGDRRAGDRLRDQQQPGAVHLAAAAVIAAVVTAAVTAVWQCVAVLRLLREPVVGIARPPVTGIIGIVRPVEPDCRARAGRARTAAMAAATVAVFGASLRPVGAGARHRVGSGHRSTVGPIRESCLRAVPRAVPGNSRGAIGRVGRLRWSR